MRGAAKAQPIDSEEVVVQERVARLESDVAHIRSDVAEMKLDIRELRGQMHVANESIHTLRTEMKSEIGAVRTDFAKLKGSVLLAVAGNTIAWLLAMGAMLGVMAKGFGWL